MKSLIAILLCVLATASTTKAGEITVAAAVSLKEAATQVAEAFQKETGEHVRFSFAGSGELAAQIEQGAPVDLFISAANDEIEALAKKDVIDMKSRAVIARNLLVLIVPADVKDPPAKFEDLNDEKLAPRIAIGQPKTVPAGRYARQVLTHYKFTDEKRIVYGNNVRQVLDYVERGEVSAGIVYHTDALLAGDKVRVVATADAKLHSPIEYPAVIVRDGKNKDLAAKFLQFLQSDRAKEILRGRGFSI